LRQKTKAMRLTEEEFIEKAKSMYKLMKEQLKSEEIDFYEYESRLDVISKDFSRDILESSLSDIEVSSDKKKKSKRDLDKSA
jgi:hypothetical protein